MAYYEALGNNFIFAASEYTTTHANPISFLKFTLNSNPDLAPTATSIYTYTVQNTYATCVGIYGKNADTSLALISIDITTPFLLRLVEMNFLDASAKTIDIH